LVILIMSAIALGSDAFSGVPRSARLASASPASLSNGRSAGGVVAIKVPGLFGTRSQPPIDIAIAFGADSTWVLGDKGVVRLNRASGRIEAAVPIEGFAENLAFCGGALWVESVVVGTRGYLLSEVDQSGNRIQRRLVVDGGPDGILQQGVAGSFQTLAAEGSDLFLQFRSKLATINARTGRVVSIRTSLSPWDIEVVNGADEAVPSNGSFGSAEEHGDIVDSTVIGNAIWASRIVTDSEHQARYELNAYGVSSGALLQPSTQNVGLVASGDGQLWGIDQPTGFYQGVLVEIKPSSGRIVRRISHPSSVGGTGANPMLAVAYGAVWLVEPGVQTVYRIAT